MNTAVRRDPNTTVFNFLHSVTTIWPINFKLKLRVKSEKKYNEKRKTVNSFQNSKQKQKYVIELNNRFGILENIEDEDNIDNDMNKKWENIKTITKGKKQQLIEKDESI